VRDGQAKHLRMEETLQRCVFKAVIRSSPRLRYSRLQASTGGTAMYQGGEDKLLVDIDVVEQRALSWPSLVEGKNLSGLLILLKSSPHAHANIRRETLLRTSGREGVLPRGGGSILS
jgi:hypothetical protein